MLIRFRLDERQTDCTLWLLSMWSSEGGILSLQEMTDTKALVCHQVTQLWVSLCHTNVTEFLCDCGKRKPTSSLPVKPPTPVMVDFSGGV